MVAKASYPLLIEEEDGAPSDVPDTLKVTNGDLTDNGDGTFSLLTAGSAAATPGGSDTQVQFNDGGSFGGDAGLLFNKTTDLLTVGDVSISSPSSIYSLSHDSFADFVANEHIDWTAASDNLDTSGTITGDGGFYQAGTLVFTYDLTENTVKIGDNAGASLNSSSENGVYIGEYAGRIATSPDSNTIVGAYAGYNLSTGYNNTFIGRGAGYWTTSAFQNVFIGMNAGQRIGTNHSNVVLGYNACGAGSTVSNFIENVVIGTDACNSMGSSCDKNVVIGHDAAFNMDSSCDRNVIIGEDAGTQIRSGTRNVIIGNESAQNILSGDYNVFLGASTTGNSLNSVIVIGYSADATADHQCVIGSNDTNGYIDDMYLGSGVTNSSPTAIVVQSTGGSGTDIAGANLTIAGGKGTGAGAGGHIIFQTAAAGATGTGLNSLSTLFEIGDDSSLGFYGASVIAQPSSTGETTGFTAGAGTGVNDDSTFTGNVGSTAYRISDIVKHLKNLGLIAS